MWFIYWRLFAHESDGLETASMVIGKHICLGVAGLPTGAGGDPGTICHPRFSFSFYVFVLITAKQWILGWGLFGFKHHKTPFGFSNHSVFEFMGSERETLELFMGVLWFFVCIDPGKFYYSSILVRRMAISNPGLSQLHCWAKPDLVVNPQCVSMDGRYRRGHHQRHHSDHHVLHLVSSYMEEKHLGFLVGVFFHVVCSAPCRAQVGDNELCHSADSHLLVLRFARPFDAFWKICSHQLSIVELGRIMVFALPISDRQPGATDHVHPPLGSHGSDFDFMQAMVAPFGDLPIDRRAVVFNDPWRSVAR